MAYRIVAADGNFTAAGTWKAVDATSLLDSQTNSTATTTAYVESAASTPGAITVEGIALRLRRTAAGSAGTFSCRIATGAALVPGTEVTVNVQDIDLGDSTTTVYIWMFFKFAAPVTLLAATNYTVSVKSSVNGTVTVARNSTAANWARMLLTSTTGAPAAGENLYVIPAWTAAGTMTGYAVQMDNNTTDDFGAAATTQNPAVEVGRGCSLVFPTAASSRLRISGQLQIDAGATVTIGTEASPVLAGNSAILEFDCAADGDFGVRNFGGTFHYGGEKAVPGVTEVSCLLNGDEAVAQTTLSVDRATSWKNGDMVGITATNRGAGRAADCETHTLNGDAAASTITTTAGLAVAKSGTSPTQARVVLLNRNVRIGSVSTSAMSFVDNGGAFSVYHGWAEIRYVGASSKPGLSLRMATGASFKMRGGVVRDIETVAGVHFTTDNNATGLTIDIDGFTGWNGAAEILRFGASGTPAYTTYTVKNVFAYKTTVSNSGAITWDADCPMPTTMENISCGGSNDASFRFGGFTNANSATEVFGTRRSYSSLESVPSVNRGFHITGNVNMVVDGLKSWRNNVSGSGTAGGIQMIAVDNCYFEVRNGVIFGNATANLAMGFTSAYGIVARFVDCVFAGDSTSATPYGWQSATAGVVGQVSFVNCTFGVAAGIFVAHSTADVFYDQSVTPTRWDVLYLNTLLASTTPETGTARNRCIRKQRHQQTNDNHSILTAQGLISRDASVFRTAAPSLKLEPTCWSGEVLEGPNSGNIGRYGTGWLIPVRDGDSRTFTCYVRKNGSYTGSQPKLILRAGVGATEDTQVAIMTGAADQWELLSAVLPAASGNGAYEIWLQVDGAAGAVYVSDILK